MTAPRHADTVRTFSRATWRREHKAAFRSGCALLRIEYPTVAAVCDENVSTVKAWSDPGRDHAIPEWAMRRIRAELPELARYVDDAMAALERPACPERVERDAPTTIAAMGRSIAQLVEALPNGVSLAEIDAALPGLMQTQAKLDALVREMHARSVRAGAAQ